MVGGNYSYKELLREFNGNFVVAEVLERAGDGRALSFSVIKVTKSKEVAKEWHRAHDIQDIDIILIPCFCDLDNVVILTMTGSNDMPSVDSVMTTEEIARFFREYWGYNCLGN